MSPLPPPAGGIATWTELILQESRRMPEVLIHHIDTAVRWRRASDTGVVKRLVGGSIQALFDLLALTQLLWKHDIHVVHLCTSGSFAVVRDMVAAWVCRAFGVRLLLHYRMGRIPELCKSGNWEWKLIVCSMKMASGVVVLDSGSQSTISRALPNVRVELIPNFVNINTLEGIRDRVTRFEQLHDRTIILFLGHVIPSKGVRELVEACRNLVDYPLVLILAGEIEGDFADELRGGASAREGGTWLTIVGELKHEVAIQYLCEAHLFVLPSYTEGFPNALLEAMALGKAVIASEVGANSDIICGGNKPCGMLIPPRSVRALEHAISQLVSNPDMAAELGMNARRRVLENYSPQPVIDRYVSLWLNRTSPNPQQ